MPCRSYSSFQQLLLVLSNSAALMLILSLLLLLFSPALPSANGIKILCYNPLFGHSHANFLGKIADTLHEAGHEVVMLTSIIHSGLNNQSSKHARTIIVPPNDFTKGFADLMGMMMGRDMWTADNGNIFKMRRVGNSVDYYGGMRKGIISACQVAMLATPGLIDQLKAEKFDVAYSEAVDICGFGLFRLLGIEKYALTPSTSIMDDSGHLTGAPSLPSYVPGLYSSFGDRMTISERTVNFVNTFYVQTLNGMRNADTKEVFKRLHQDVPELEDIIANSSYFFINSEPLIDFQRLVTRRIVDIGGISVTTSHKPLEEPFSSLLSARPRTVLISFGSVVLSHHMPEPFKETIRAAARHFQDVTFIWKYEKPEENVAAGIPNLHTSPWVPQYDLLKDPRLAAFITHGGLGSTTEATLSGVPVIAIPVMADQMRNGKLIERLDTGVLLHKDDLARPEKLIDALHQVLDTDKYTKRAQRVAAMVADQPQSPRDRLVSHFEFMAKYGPLTELHHVGSTLGTIKLYNLDIFALLGLGIIFVLCIVIFIVVGIARFVLKCQRAVKRKSD